VLFERICRENGITQRLTKPRSPTTTGKIERLHQTLQHELLNDHEPFATMADAQAVVDAWRKEYNASRPHQSLGMAFPAARFAPATDQLLGLRVPAALTPPAPPDQPSAPTTPREVVPAVAAPGSAVEVDRVVPPSGNLWLSGQQIWLGPALAGRTIRLWAGPDRVHVLLDGHRIKTLPSRLDRTDLARLAATGAAPAGPPPLPPPAGSVIEVERSVSASGNVSVGNHVLTMGQPLAGSGSPSAWTARSPTSSATAPSPALSPAQSPNRPVPCCAAHAPEPWAGHSCPNRSGSEGESRSAAPS
jgi:hypothetical protein